MISVLRNIGSLVSCAGAGNPDDPGIIKDAALVWEDGRILWTGEDRLLPEEYNNAVFEDAEGTLVIPGLIDCHTHLAFAGWRAGEFVKRVQGKSYLEIAQEGGGIVSTVAKTRAAGQEELAVRCLGFLKEMASLGVTAVECKSGYGLNLKDEIKLLRVYRDLQTRQPLTIVPTFLGAHTIPPEFAAKREAYLSLVIAEMLPAVSEEKLARFCDVFVEKPAFTPDEGRRILEAAAGLGMRGKIHADQLTDCGGARLAAETGCISADHLEHISDDGVQALKEKGVVAVMLPLASLYTFSGGFDARKLIAAKVPVAVATDFNPGSAPSFHLPLAMSMACLINRLTPSQALKGATLYAARAIAEDKLRGSLEPGKMADFALIDAPDVDTWLYALRANCCVRTVKEGVTIYERR